MTHGRRTPPQPALVRATSLGRLRIGLLLISMVVSVFAARLFQLQGIDAAAYAAKARAEGVVSVTLPATRGAITDRNGLPLASSVDGLMLVADPTVTVRNASEIATIIARRLDVDYFDLLTRLRKPGTQFQYLVRRVPSTKARAVLEEIDARGFKGVDTRRDPVRSYPAGDVGANLVGFINDEDEAAEGAELMFDKTLMGRDGSATYEVGGGNRIPLGDSSTVQPRSGKDVALTIDRDVQWYTQRVLRAAVQDSRGSEGAAVVMDVRTGQLLALADFPTYDANRPSLAREGWLGSKALSDVYEPGSVQKVLTVASLLDAGKVAPDAKITVPPFLVRQGREINDYFDHARLRLTLTGVIAKSSNIGTVLAAERMSHQQHHDYLRSFGLGARTGVGIVGAGESAGLLPAWRKWMQLSQDTIAFGQGLSVNAVQMAAAVNAVANDGVYVAPSLVKGRATTALGDEVGSDTAIERRVVSRRAARWTARMMEAVVDPDVGTAASAGVEGYRVAGKTGTAQRVVGGVYDGSFTTSFAGFAPADKPRFLVYVVVHDPQNGGGGGTIGGPAFAKVMGYLLQKYAVPPTGSAAPKPVVSW